MHLAYRLASTANDPLAQKRYAYVSVYLKKDKLNKRKFDTKQRL